MNEKESSMASFNMFARSNHLYNLILADRLKSFLQLKPLGPMKKLIEHKGEA